MEKIAARKIKSMKPVFNRQAKAKYEFLESWEAGLILSGAEVKSVKTGGMNLTGSYVSFEKGEIWLKNAHISAYQQRNQNDYDPTRTRKLLLTRQERQTLIGKLQQKGLTIIPEKVYSKVGLIKVTISLVRGLKKYDKRQKIKKRDIDRNISYSLKKNLRV